MEKTSYPLRNPIKRIAKRRVGELETSRVPIADKARKRREQAKRNELRTPKLLASKFSKRTGKQSGNSVNGNQPPYDRASRAQQTNLDSEGSDFEALDEDQRVQHPRKPNQRIRVPREPRDAVARPPEFHFTKLKRVAPLESGARRQARTGELVHKILRVLDSAITGYYREVSEGKQRATRLNLQA